MIIITVVTYELLKNIPRNLFRFDSKEMDERERRLTLDGQIVEGGKK